MFYHSIAFCHPDGNWDVSAVTDVQSLFNNRSAFNQPTGDWDFPAVTDLLFLPTDISFFNQPISRSGIFDSAACSRHGSDTCRFA